MVEHVILYRQHTENAGPMEKQHVCRSAYCSCGWETDPVPFAFQLEDEIGNHLYEVWLSTREEPV